MNFSQRAFTFLIVLTFHTGCSAMLEGKTLPMGPNSAKLGNPVAVKKEYVGQFRTSTRVIIQASTNNSSGSLKKMSAALSTVVYVVDNLLVIPVHLLSSGHSIKDEMENSILECSYLVLQGEFTVGFNSAHSGQDVSVVPRNYIGIFSVANLVKIKCFLSSEDELEDLRIKYMAGTSLYVVAPGFAPIQLQLNDTLKITQNGFDYYINSSYTLIG